MASTTAPGPQDRQVLSTADVPKVDTYVQPPRPWWATPGVAVALITAVAFVIVVLIGSVVWLATQDTLRTTLDALGDFFARDDVPIIVAITGFVSTLLAIGALWVRMNGVAVFTKLGARAANNAEAHVGKVLPEQMHAELGALREEIREGLRALVEGPAAQPVVVNNAYEPTPTALPEQGYGQWVEAAPEPEPQPQAPAYAAGQWTPEPVTEAPAPEPTRGATRLRPAPQGFEFGTDTIPRVNADGQPWAGYDGVQR